MALLMPAELNLFIATKNLLPACPPIPSYGRKGWLQDNVNPKEGVEDPTLGQGHFWWGDSEYPAGAETSQEQRKWRSLGGFLSSQNNVSQAVSTILN